MKQSTRQIIRAALEADDTVSPRQAEAALSILDERPARDPSGGPPSLLLTQAETARMLNCSRFTVRRLVLAGTIQQVVRNQSATHRRSGLSAGQGTAYPAAYPVPQADRSTPSRRGRLSGGPVAGTALRLRNQGG